MPDALESADAARSDVTERVARWREAFGEVEKEAREGRPIAERAVADAASTDAHDDLEALLRRARRGADRAGLAIGDVISSVRRLRADWVAERRFAPEEVKRFVADLFARLEEEPVAVARRFLAALFDALDGGRWEVVATLTAEELDWPAPVSGAHAITEGIVAWAQGDDDRGRATMDALGRDEVPEFAGVLT